jgi:dihydroneopterin aldolase
MDDRLAVRGIEGFGHHGVLDVEKRDGQVFVVDLVLTLDTRRAASTDDLQDTVDYGTLVAKVKKGIETDPVDLIETLASRLAGICLEDPLVSSAEITVHKPHAPIEAAFADVGVTIHRTRNPPTQPPEPM